ncbi:MAG: hypothetical protein ABIZ07_02995 [Dermatophilaceae bacterium]
MAIGGRRPVDKELQDYARLLVRAGFLDDARMRAEVTSAITAEMPQVAVVDAEILARAWLGGASAQLRKDALLWSEETDHDRLQATFSECAEHRVPVLQGVEDHWSAKAELDRLADEGRVPRGIAWFTAADVWHAIDQGMLEVNVWHGTTANAATGDALLDAVLGCFGRHGLEARFDEGRIEVSAHWQRRP